MYLILLIIFASATSKTVQQSNERCDTSHLCISSLSHADCQSNGTYLELNESINCCPQCRGGLPYKAINCDTTETGSTECAPGLQCQATSTNNTCYLNKGSTTSAHIHHTRTHHTLKILNFNKLAELCSSYTYHMPDLKQVPTCEQDGSFAAKQCKGDRLYGR